MKRKKGKYEIQESKKAKHLIKNSNVFNAIRNKIKLFFCLLFFASSFTVLLGQTANIKTSVKFDNNKHKLRMDAKQIIDETLDTLAIENIVKVTVVGHTDNIADSVYNIKLSEKRSQSVKDYLISKGFDAQIIHTNYFGMEKPIATNENEDGKQKNRRVDIIFFIKSYPTKTKTDSKQEAFKQSDIEIDTPKEDTTIILPQGTHIVFNRSEYLELKDCIELIEANSSQEILNNGLSLMTVDGGVLASCGMIKIELKGNCTDVKCFKYPIKIQFPVPENSECDYCKKSAGVWILTTKGWENFRGNRIKIIKKDNKRFYQFELKCPNTWINCDCKVEEGNKRKIKIKRPYEIVNLKISFDCPTVVFNLEPERRKNVVKHDYIPCWRGEKTVMATIVNKQGDTLLLEQQPLNDLQKRTLFPRCYKTEEKVIIGKRLWVFPVYQREMYRKYIIKPEMLKIKN